MQTFREAVSNRLYQALEDSAPFIDKDIADAIWDEFINPARLLSGSGKRTRALLIAAGYELFDGPGSPIHAGTAAELYQLSALAHDDIIDDSHTRRGVPAVHRSFATCHRAVSLMGSSNEFGIKAGILLGDFLLSLAALEMEKAEHSSPDALARARQLFHEMTAETAYGQYLDLRAELTALNNDQESAVNDALLVLRHKSARYSVELPLMIGGTLAGAHEEDITLLSKVGRPLGIAFQLRDDELGIFGDPLITGKPAAGDIMEGKHTVLLALTRGMADTKDTSFIDDVLGRELTAADVAEIRRIVTNSGAFAAHEEMIKSYEDEAVLVAASLPDGPILRSVMSSLEQRRS